MIRFKLIVNLNFLIHLLLIISCIFCYDHNYQQEPQQQCPKRCNCLNTIVNCANRNLKMIPSTLPIWTEILYINDNPLETISLPSSSTILSKLIDTPINLTFIDFTNTNLHYLDQEVFVNIFNDINLIQQNLIKLKFDQNNLKIFPMIIGAINLRSLSLSENKLTYDSIRRIDINQMYPNLEYLDLSSNLIKTIPKHFLSSSRSTYNNSITHLILNQNEIEVIEDDAFELFKNLKVLKLSKNLITIISKSWLGRFNYLKELDLNYNQINKIGVLAFEGLESLQILKLKRNKFEDLADGSFWGLSKLQKLNLDHNNITRITEGWTYGLKSLSELSLRYNSIKSIANKSWNSANNLIEINLTFNNLKRIEKETFEKLNSLQKLRLSSNQISFIDENSFKFLNNLKVLDLSNNNLSWTIESSNGFFSGLEKLKQLRLDSNQIRLIYTHTFNGLGNLQMLNLTNNPISSIQKNSFDWFKNLNELYLENIDLLCDCTMKWLTKWLESSTTRRSFAEKIHCKHPHELAYRTSKSFLNVDPEEFKCQDFLKPYLIDDFNNITQPIAAIKNKEIIFNCKAATSSEDGIIFKWFKNNQIVDHDRASFETIVKTYSENVKHYTSIFHLINIQDSDQGDYNCMASNKYGKVYSQKFPVNVYVAPYFVKKPQNITVRIGHTAKLECAAKGQPNPSISWQKDGGDNFPAAMERRMRVMHDDDVFFIVEIKKIDMGSYSCHASNDAGTVVSTVFLNVIELPSFVRKMVDRKSTLESTVSLECMAAGIPMPQITWYKDGHLLQQTERHFFTAEGQLLIIVKLKSSDQGVYTCNISNQYGTVQDSSYLEIINFNSTKKNDWIYSILSIIRSHSTMILTILICVILTSLAWIFVICYIQRPHHHQQDHVFGESSKTASGIGSNYSSSSGIIINQTNSTGDHHHLHHRITESPITATDSDFKCETLSTSDTGLGDSCPSYEEEHELINYNSNNNHRILLPKEYHSLPRKSNNNNNRIQYINNSNNDRNGPILQVSTDNHHNYNNHHHYYSSSLPRNTQINKQLKRQQQRRQQKMMNIRNNNNNNNSRILNADNDNHDDDDDYDNWETTIEMLNHHNHPQQQQLPLRRIHPPVPPPPPLPPSSMMTFSLNGKNPFDRQTSSPY